MIRTHEDYIRVYDTLIQILMSVTWRMVVVLRFVITPLAATSAHVSLDII